MVRYCTIGYFFFLTVAVFGQQVNHSLRIYTAVDGLPQSQVKALAEDKNGYLWMATLGGGLARFDGREFTVYTTLDGLQSNFVNGLLIDGSDNIWTLHHGGVTKYDGISFKKYDILSDLDGNDFMYNLLIHGDTLIALSQSRQVAKIHKDSVYYSEMKGLAGMFNGVTPDELFMLYYDGRLIRRSGGVDQKLGEVDLKLKPKFFRRDDELWYWSKEGLYRFGEKEIEKLPYTTAKQVCYYDKIDDSFWTCDLHNLYKEYMKDGQMMMDTIVRDVMVYTVLIDSERNVWIGSDGGGLFKYYPKDFERCGSDNLKGTMAVYVDKYDTTWIGTMSRGIWKSKKGKTKQYVQDTGISFIRESPDGTLWVGSYNGLGKYDRRKGTFKWYTEEHGLPNKGTMALSFDDKGGMWVGTRQGVVYYDGKAFQSFSGDSKLSKMGVWSIHYSIPDQTLFVGSQFGVTAYKDGKVGELDILKNTVALSLQPYRDSLLLIGTAGGGVVVYNPKRGSKRYINSKEGLTSDFVYFVGADPDDHIWVGMVKGISRIQLNKDLTILENLHFDYDNGLTGVETNHNAFYLGEENKFFGLVDGLYQFNDYDDKDVKSFDLHFTDVEVLYGEYESRDYADTLIGSFKIPSNPVFPHDRNHLTFHFNRVDKRHPKSMKFKYYLENFDKTWSQPSSATSVTYSNLPPGEYTLRVMATNKEGSWSENTLVYPFTVKAPFYMTASFIAGLIIFLAGSITLLMYLRVRQRVNKMIEMERIRLKEAENLRKEIARDFHDEMGNQLTRIINYISLLKLRADSGNGTKGLNLSVTNSTSSNIKTRITQSHFQQSELYKKVEESAKLLYTGTRDFIWAIDPVNDELSKLFIHIRDFGEKLFEEKNIQFRAYDEVREKIPLPNGFSREVNLIFKEAMTNAFKYSDSNNVRFSLHRINGFYRLSFEDDGVGFEVDDVVENGLRNIRLRAEKIGSNLSIKSSKGSGTEVILDLVLTKNHSYGHAI